MKTTYRSVPNDILSVEEGGKTIQIITYKQEIAVTVDGIINRLSFKEFYAALQDILIPPPVSAPYFGDKAAATPEEKGEKGVP